MRRMQGVEELVPGEWYYHDHYPGRRLQVRELPNGTVDAVHYKQTEDGWIPSYASVLENWDASMMRLVTEF